MGTFTVVKSNDAEYDYTNPHFDKLVIGQLLVLDGHARPYYVKSVGEDGRYHVAPIPFPDEDDTECTSCRGTGYVGGGEVSVQRLRRNTMKILQWFKPSVRPEKTHISYVPQEDITTYELAQVVSIITLGERSTRWLTQEILSDMIIKKGAGVSRHFKNLTVIEKI